MRVRTARIVIPKFVDTIHNLSEFLISAYCYKMVGDCTHLEEFKLLINVASLENIPIKETPKVTAAIIVEYYGLEISNRNKNHLMFVMEKHLTDTLLNK